ncbi:MAG TPA: FAD-dependent oxidoreductase [Nocardioidaceae bacterium]|nr:FAD-dependent oxidoreductase [Nocardioidaceae bacterium]
MTASYTRASADAARVPYWLDDPSRPEPSDPLESDTEADLVVVGGGYTGLWTALLAKERDPGHDVVLLEADACGSAASGRNGGFASPSLTHGFENGMSRWPDDLKALLRLGSENLDAIEATVQRHGIDCRFERTGELDVATEPYQVDELRDSIRVQREHGVDVEWLPPDRLRELVDSPTYLGAQLDREVALVEPARLAWGLRQACLDAGVRVHEGTPASGLSRRGGAVRVVTPGGTVRAGAVALATNAYPSLLRRIRLLTVPVYDYAIVTEPLDPAQRAAIGWAGRQGIGDSGNQFHYYRLTRDDRILFGGYDAIYHYGSRITPDLDQRTATFELLYEHLVETFPALADIRLSHTWGGVVDTSTQFCAFYGRAMRGRATYAAGFTGLGVAATRFAADVMLDLLAGEETERTRLRMTRSRPTPFPPEPVRWAAVQATRWSLARADANDGRRNAWLRLLDRLGLGFDS